MSQLCRGALLPGPCGAAVCSILLWSAVSCPYPMLRETHRSRFSPALEVAGSGLGERPSAAAWCPARKGAARWRCRRVSTDHKNQLAAKVAGLAQPVRSHGFAEPIPCHFRRTDGACRNQRHDALEMVPVPLRRTSAEQGSALGSSDTVAISSRWRLTPTCAQSDSGAPPSELRLRRRADGGGGRRRSWRSWFRYGQHSYRLCQSSCPWWWCH